MCSRKTWVYVFAPTASTEVLFFFGNFVPYSENDFSHNGIAFIHNFIIIHPQFRSFHMSNLAPSKEQEYVITQYDWHVVFFLAI